jgi:hypothetical protein
MRTVERCAISGGLIVGFRSLSTFNIPLDVFRETIPDEQSFDSGHRRIILNNTRTCFAYCGIRTRIESSSFPALVFLPRGTAQSGLARHSDIEPGNWTSNFRKVSSSFFSNSSRFWTRGLQIGATDVIELIVPFRLRFGCLFVESLRAEPLASRIYARRTTHIECGI